VSHLTKLFLTCLAERRASSACGTSAESKHPEDVFFTMLVQGILSKLFSSQTILFSMGEEGKQLG
jgi:hypothetical protein